MTRAIRLGLAVVLVLRASTSLAQLTAAKDGPIVYGHHHIYSADVDAQKKFFVDTLGGTPITVGTYTGAEIVRFPNVLVFVRRQAPTGGSRGTSVNHIGFSAPDLRAVVSRIKANGFEMITRSEVAADREVRDDIALAPAGGGNQIAFALAPDGLKVEFVELKTQTIPIAMHHVHFFGPQNLDMQGWYVKTFGATARSGGAFPSAVLPGVALNFSPSPTPVTGTQGRVIDHIGFEVKNLEAFTKTLQENGIKLERPYTKVETLGTAIAFIRDPWGTYIELTEGLDKIN